MARETTPAELLGKRKRGRPAKNASKESKNPKSERKLYTEWVRTGFFSSNVELFLLNKNYYFQIKHTNLLKYKKDQFFDFRSVSDAHKRLLNLTNRLIFLNPGK